MAKQGISRGEFAKRDGCDRSLVSRAARDGKLTVFADNTLDPAQVGTPWRSGNEDRDLPRDSDENPANDVNLHDGDAPYSRAEATRRKENYLARLRQLEYDKRSSLVVLREDAAAEVADRYSRLKSRLMPLGAEIAPRLAPLSDKSAAEIKAVVDAAVRSALEELTVPDAVQ